MGRNQIQMRRLSWTDNMSKSNMLWTEGGEFSYCFNVMFLLLMLFIKQIMEDCGVGCQFS